MMFKKDITNCMTSELLYEALKANANYAEKHAFIEEYKRRLKIMGLTNEQMVEFRKMDEVAINNGCYINLFELFAKQPFIKPDMTENSINLRNCTFSELVYLTDDANADYASSSTDFHQSAWQLICKHALEYGICLSAFEVHQRMKSIGISLMQESIFIGNECLIVQRLRWKTTSVLAWSHR